jgi:anti-sigma B factor antagonist
MFEIETREEGVVAMIGRLDAAQVAKAETTLSTIYGPVAIDVSQLEYISSAGIGIILKTYKRLHEAGHGLKLVNPTPHVRNVFHYAGLDTILGLE